MSISKVIRDLKHRTSVSSLDALHALAMTQGDDDLGRAIDYLRTPRLATKALYVFDSALAARLAAGMIATGLWFECEQLDREKWYFAVAPAGHARLVALHDELLRSQRSLTLSVVRSRSLPAAIDRIPS
jgi:hypothetical protein